MASEDGLRGAYRSNVSTNEEANSAPEENILVDENVPNPDEKSPKQTRLPPGPSSPRQASQSSSLRSSSQNWPNFSGLGAAWDNEDFASLQRAVPSAILPDSSGVRLVPRVGQLRVTNPRSPDPLADFVLPPNTVSRMP